MANERVLACIGLNGFEKARLRLLLGEAAERLDMAWQVGEPEQADLLLLAPGSLEAEAAALRSRGRGVRCVNLGAPGEVGDEFLPAGFGVDDVVRVLKSVTARDSRLEKLDQRSPEFFDLPESEPVDHGVLEAVDLERFLRRDSGEHTLDKVVPYQLQDTTSVEPVKRSHVSSRAQVRSSERDPFGRGAPPEPEHTMGIDARHDRHLSLSGDPGHGKPLLAYLGDQALVAPSQLLQQGAEPLILDPKNAVYMIVGDLASVEPYVTCEPRESDFERLTTRELERWRALCEPRPYLRLKWLIALRTGDGWLPRHLDPGGSYRLRNALALDEHFDAQERIGHAMRDWLRVHEIASQARVDMQAVFNTIAAYDAIGWLEWRPRDRFR